MQEFVYASSGIYGRVEKKSVLPKRLWSFEPRELRSRSQRLSEWTYAHEVRQEPVSELVEPISCGLVINHKYKMIFVRQLKSGSKLGEESAVLGSRCADPQFPRHALSHAQVCLLQSIDSLE